MGRPQTMMFLLLMLIIENKATNEELLLKEETISFAVGKSSSEVVLDKTLQVLAPTSEVVASETCRRQARLFARGVREGVDWAVQMFNASSKTPLHTYIGRYDECVSLENIPTEEGAINGKHCFVTIGSPMWGSTIDVYRRISYHISELESKLRLVGRNDGVKEEITSTSAKGGLVWTLCVPSSCQPHDVRAHLSTTLPGLMTGNDSVIVSGVVCSSSDDRPHLTVGDALIISMLVVSLSLVIFATWRHFYNTPPGWIQAFSLLGGVRELFSVSPPSESEGKLRLPVLDGIRVLSMLSLFFYHRSVLWEHIPPASKLSFLDDVRLQRSRYTANIHVDTFILLSGLLVSFNHLKDRQRGASFSLISFYMQRLVRIAPIFWLVVLLIQSNLMFYVGGGTLFRKNVLNSQINCSKNLPQVLMFLGNFLSPDHMCILHTWHTAADMQLFWLSPIFISLLYTRPALGKATIAFLLPLSIILYYAVTCYYPSFYLGLPFGQNVEKQWFSPYMRLTPWLVGLGLGSALHTTGSSPAHLSRLHATACWIISAAMMITAFWMGPVVLETQSQHVAAVFYTLQKPMWSLGVAWVILACSRGYGGFLAAFLSWRGFLLLSRISYAFFITHAMVIGIVAITSRTIPEDNTFSRMACELRDLLLCLLTAMVLHLVVELPAINLRKAILRTRSTEAEPDSKKAR